MDIIWKTRIDKVIYNLVYPAFFGNMVYDIILRKLAWKGDVNLVYPDLLSCITIGLFAIVDFMHLYGDMNEIVKQPKNKSSIYLLCDIATPFLLFMSFVLIKEQEYRIGFILFLLIPCIIYFYKKKNPVSKKYFLLYFISCIIIITILSFVNNNILPTYGLYSIIFSLIIYSIYVIHYYPKKCKEFDVEYMKIENAIY